jgi:hypothetical protein
VNGLRANGWQARSCEGLENCDVVINDEHFGQACADGQKELTLQVTCQLAELLTP